ncbi:NDR1/HIN1-like protein 1 [Impatiens glandulifera]|uniref:NDR1/HIN1-like protein 1 n=1 Tax=Impatiens glandulifera TaxID=253017 RepID=UPI001FB0D7B8|nr:NDR1/HIN1-like protein 1 [Impatiens glandulifera]
MTDKGKNNDEISSSNNYPPNKTRQNIFAGITIFLLLIVIIALILWLVYRPQTPIFTVVSVSIYALNVTLQPVSSVSASVQFTIVTRNPNQRVSIFYDRLSTVVSYHNRPITPPVELPPLFHEKRSTVILSPVMGGTKLMGFPVPVPEEVSNGLSEDLEGFGMVQIGVVVTGKLRWKAGFILTTRKSVVVRCDVAVGFKKWFSGQVPLLSSSNVCHVYV